MYQHLNKFIFRYRGKDRLVHKKNKNYNKYVNDHHIIPKSLAKHKLIKSINFDIHSNDNLFIMPKYVAIDKFNLHPNIMVHEGSHLKYNAFVKKNLDEIFTYSNNEEKCYYLWLFLSFLKANLKFNKDNIPWN